MNIIRIVSKKIPKDNITDIYPALTLLQNELTEAVRIHNKGYISSQSYFPLTNDIAEANIIYNISDWKSHDYWLEWYHSDVRYKIYKHYSLLESETHIKLKNRTKFNDIPLL